LGKRERGGINVKKVITVGKNYFAGDSMSRYPYAHSRAAPFENLRLMN
jgi:hypothetical protein